MITIHVEDIYPGLLIFLRASGLFLILPVFSGSMIPSTVRIGMAGSSRARTAAQQVLARTVRRRVRRSGATGRGLAEKRKAAEARGLVTEAPMGS